MLPQFLLPETTVREAGTGPNSIWANTRARRSSLTLGITRIIEQESIDLSIWGSADGADWGTKPVAAFPQKFYCGTYQIMLDLSDRPDIKHLRVKWARQPLGQRRSQAAVQAFTFSPRRCRQMVAVGASLVAMPAPCRLPSRRNGILNRYDHP